MVEDHTSGGVTGTVTVEKDLRGKRKINDMELVFIVGNFNAAGTAFTITCEGIIRQVFLR